MDKQTKESMMSQIKKDMEDSKSKKKNDKQLRIEEERQAIEKMNKETEEERIKCQNEKTKKQNEKWEEYKDYMNKKEALKKPKAVKEEKKKDENIQDLATQNLPLKIKETKENEAEGISEEDYNRLYDHYMDLKKEQEQKPVKQLEQDIPKNVDVPVVASQASKNYQDPKIYNTSQRLAELNKYNKGKIKSSQKGAMTKDKPHNFFDNKNLEDYNQQKSSILADIQNKENSNVKSNEAEKRKQYKQILDEQIKQNQKQKQEITGPIKSKRKVPAKEEEIKPSSLEQNPITNPVNSYNYKKYLESHNL